MKAEKEDAQPRVQTLTVLSRSRTKRIMQNEKTGTGGSRCRFCLWYGLWAECKENYVNINCNKKVAIFSKVKAKTATFLVRVAGFEPTASWSRNSVCLYMRRKYVKYMLFCSDLRTFLSGKSTPV